MVNDPAMSRLRIRRLRRLVFIASGTREFVAEVGGAALGGEEPGAKSPGRVVADVLGVAALEVGDPVEVGVLVEGDDFAEWHTVEEISPQGARSSQEER
jgi:hypothetical protein